MVAVVVVVLMVGLTSPLGKSKKPPGSGICGEPLASKPDVDIAGGVGGKASVVPGAGYASDADAAAATAASRYRCCCCCCCCWAACPFADGGAAKSTTGCAAT